MSMKVLHVIDSLGLGGAQTLVQGIFEAQKDNKDIFLFALRERDITTKVDHTNVTIFNSSSKYSFASLSALKKIVEKEEIEILHCHLFRSNVFGWLLKVIWFRNIKLIFHEHGRILTNNPSYKSFLKISQSSVNLFIAVSEGARIAIERIGIPDSKIKILYNFVDTQKFNRSRIAWDIENERQKLGISGSQFVVGYAGRLAEIKGWREFINAAASISKENSNIKFLVVGDGPGKEEMLAIIESLNLRSHVVYLGYVTDMVWFYSLVNCCVIPSHTELFPLTPLEAQSMQVPVIASDIPGLREVVSDKTTGLLFQRGDVEDLREAILLLEKESTLRNRLVEGGIKNAEKFSLTDYLPKLAHMYVDLA